MNLIPKLTDAESALLRESIRRDGVQYPVLQDASGRVIDGHHRKQICIELGVYCPIETRDVDDETAERLSVTLNLARRQLTTATKYDLVAWLAEAHEADAKKAALDRMAEGGYAGGRGRAQKGSPSEGQPFRASTDIAKRINADLAEQGEALRVSKSTVERARLWKRAPESEKAEVRAGRKSVTDIAQPEKRAANTTRPAKRISKREPDRQVHTREQLDSLARIRAADAEAQYQSMLNAPPGKTNLPLMRRAEQIGDLLNDLYEMPAEKAAGHVPPERLPEFMTSRAEWWLEFTERCEKRWHDEVPDLPARRPMRVIPLAERDLSRTALTLLEWLRTCTEPVTVIEAAVALRIQENTARQYLKALADAGLADVAGMVDKRLAYIARIDTS